MKYIVMIGDGMADEPCARLEGKTPLAAAQKPYMNYLASMGVNGLVDTVPEGMTPESDTANLAIMGYDPRTYSRGRSPLEALSMGIEMQDDETAIRANLVSLSDEGEPYEEKRMLDHSGRRDSHRASRRAHRRRAGGAGRERAHLLRRRVLPALPDL